MKFKILPCILAMFSLTAAISGRALAQGTAFTYDGRLNINNNVTTGSFDLQFTLYSDPTLNQQVGASTNAIAVGVTNGLFTVLLDFGPNVFVGGPRWLEIGVRTNGDLSGFTHLSPRQQLTPTPYAIFAGNAGNATTAATASSVSANAVAGGGIQDNTITAAKLSGGQVVKTLNGLTDSVIISAGANVTLTTNGNSLQLSSSGGVTSGWALGGNSNTTSANFLGTGDNLPLELRVNNARALRLVPTSDSPNVIGGANINIVSSGMQGATIGGGGSIATYGAPFPNQIAAYHGTIGGGLGNSIRSNAYESTIAGGNQNLIDTNANRSSIGGGFLNTIQLNASTSTIGGGYVNSIQTNAQNATIGGGSGNVVHATAASATIAGGANNVIQPNATLSTIGGGLNNAVSANEATVAGGTINQILAGADVATIAGGYGNVIQTYCSAATISGGSGNTVVNSNSTVGPLFGTGAVIGGGYGNIATGDSSTVGGGSGNRASDEAATVPGGHNNVADGYGSFAAGVNAHVIYEDSFIWGDGSQEADSTGPNRFEVLATGGVSFYTGPNNVNIVAPAALNFGGTTRQMLDLFGLGYGIGVQNFTLYSRSDGGFAWYAGGVHNNNQTNAGGGATLMTLDSVGDLHINNNFTATTVLASTSFNDAISGVVSFGRGVYGSTTSAGPNYAGVWGQNTAPGGTGVVGVDNNTGSTGVYGKGTMWGGYFDGPVSVCSLQIRGGCDVAEPFQMAHEEIPKGSVVVIDDENTGQLKLSDRAYDTRVAGIVSGANGINPGIAMHQEGEFEGGQNVALSGRVYVLADASNGAIKPGDLLTTSATPGHAMKVLNQAKSQGAILGKAMSGLNSGKGMVLVLVTLQ